MKIIYLKKVRTHFSNLIPKLHDLGYFGFAEAAKKYVDEIFAEIEVQISIQRHRPAPKYFDKYGKEMKYIVVKKNKNTHWYAFFEITQTNGEIIYKVRYISNNHVIAQYL
jgi:hypothetical protein